MAATTRVGLVALVVALALVGGRGIAQAATITVNNLNDSGTGSLRQAIADATAGDTIDFSVTGTITLTGGRLSIDKELAITGPGATSLTISGNNASRVLQLGGVTVSISGVTISGGNAGGSAGGGVNAQGTLTLTDSVVSANVAALGGAIYNSGTLNLVRTTVNGNSDTQDGGGFYISGGTTTLTDSTVNANTSVGLGGGFYVSSGAVTQVSVGRTHTCALLDSGAVRCWGQGGFGRLGYGNENDIGDDETPASAGDVDVGGTVAQIDTGAVRCWGLGSDGRLGYGNNNDIGDDETPASAGDVDIVDPRGVVTLGVAGLPAGAGFAPGAPANPVSVTFTWVPTSADVGSHAVTFTAQDSTGLTATPHAVNIAVTFAGAVVPSLSWWGLTALALTLASVFTWRVLATRDRRAGTSRLRS